MLTHRHIYASADITAMFVNVT